MRKQIGIYNNCIFKLYNWDDFSFDLFGKIMNTNSIPIAHNYCYGNGHFNNLINKINIINILAKFKKTVELITQVFKRNPE